jgi:hypothetical protein
MKHLVNRALIICISVVFIINIVSAKAQGSIDRISCDLSGVLVGGKSWTNEAGAGIFIGYGKQYRINERIGYGWDIGSINYGFDFIGKDTAGLVGNIKLLNAFNGFRVQTFLLIDPNLRKKKNYEFGEITMFADYYYRIKSNNENDPSVSINGKDYFKNYSFGLSFLIGEHFGNSKPDRKVEFAVYTGMEVGWKMMKYDDWKEHCNFSIVTGKLGIRFFLF